MGLSKLSLGSGKNMVLNPGQVLQNGRYTIERELGQDLYSISYLARGADDQRWVIKILNPAVLKTLSAEEQNRLQARFSREATALAACSDRSRYIVKVRPPFPKDNITCLPFEYPGGTRLQDRSQPILKEETALEYIRQLGEAVEILHSKDLVHRDICPAKISLRIRDGKAEAVLTDFDLAMDCDTELSKTRSQERTDGFSAIELYSRGKPVGPYTDVYSLAATLYEMLTGIVPVKADSRQIHGTPLESPQNRNPEISSKVTKAILAGMEIQPEKRPQTVSAWLKQLGLKEKPYNLSEKSSINWTKWGAIWAGIGVGVAILGIMITIWLTPKSPPKQTPTSTPTSPQTL
jgi:serine/threonine protein kinase